MNVIDAPGLGLRFEIREHSEDLLEFDAVGRARGFITQYHAHTIQSERFEVIEGTLRLVIDGREHLLGPGETMEIPAGTPHRQLAGDEGSGRVRVQVRPAARTMEFLELLAAYPRLRSLAGIARFRESRPTLPRLPSREYVFVDEWDVDAPRESVFAAIADARSYPTWWKPVYLSVESEGEPEVGSESRQHFKGRLPYHLRTRSRITRLEAPEAIGAEVDGDLRGTGLWTLTELPDGWHARALRLARARRPAAAAAAHTGPAAGAALEPRVGDRAGAGGAGAVRPSCRRSRAHHSSMMSAGRRRLAPVVSSKRRRRCLSVLGWTCSALAVSSIRISCSNHTRRVSSSSAPSRPSACSGSRWRPVKASPSASSERIAGRIERSARLNTPSCPKASAVCSARLAIAKAAGRAASRAGGPTPTTTPGTGLVAVVDSPTRSWSSAVVSPSEAIRRGAGPSSARARKATYSRSGSRP